MFGGMSNWVDTWIDNHPHLKMEDPPTARQSVKGYTSIRKTIDAARQTKKKPKMNETIVIEENCDTENSLIEAKNIGHKCNVTIGY